MLLQAMLCMYYQWVRVKSPFSYLRCHKICPESDNITWDPGSANLFFPSLQRVMLAEMLPIRKTNQYPK